MILQEVLGQTLTAVGEALERSRPGIELHQVGYVTQVNESIARVKGLRNIGYEEMLAFPGNLLGLAIDLEENDTGVVLLGNSEHLKAGDEVRTTGRQVDVPVGDKLLGRVINATGQALDGGPDPAWTKRRAIEQDAPAIMDRAPVTVPLQTGIKAIDALIPIGRGQRELIVGDRQTGKTSVALNAILNQYDSGVICIYCAIGQRSTAVARVIETLRNKGAMDYSIVMVASGDDSPGLQYITPYAATALAEYFMAAGSDVLLIYDDLTRHARAYRELSLLLRRPPGREAYPGDIFYIHSRLLERATHLRDQLGGGSLTALPIVETQAGDISAYIPTNLISITDGQIYLSPELARKGFMPAVDIGKSVSRVGGKTQLPAYLKVAGDLRLSYTQFGELETFSRFGTRLDKATRDIIARGRRVREILKQYEYQTLRVREQIAILYAAANGLLDAVALEDIAAAEQAIRDGIAALAGEQCTKLENGAKMSHSDWEQLEQSLKEIVSPLGSANPEKSS